MILQLKIDTEGMTMVRGTDVTDATRQYRKRNEGAFPDKLVLRLQKETDLRYGENPNQPAAVYHFADGVGQSIATLTNIHVVKEGKEGLSATNIMDATRALDILKFFKAPSVAVMKHCIPSGFVTQHGGNSLDTIYRLARDVDARSAFGSVVVFNRPIDTATAQAIMESYVEVVVAPGFEEGTMGIFHTKKDIRVVTYSNLDKLPRFEGDDTQGLYDLKMLPTGRVVVQTPYLTSIRSVDDLVLDPLVRKKEKEDSDEKTYVVERDPTPTELRDMFTAWYVNFGVRSNGIVLVKNGVTLAVGSGQQERVGAVEQAIVKAYQKEMDRNKISYDPLAGVNWDKCDEALLSGAVCSSDAFFPKRDNIDILARVGIRAVIQPGGSKNDYEIIQAVNEHKMAMAYTRERCFGHF